LAGDCRIGSGLSLTARVRERKAPKCRVVLRLNDMNTNNQHHRAILEDIAERAMLERGLLPEFSGEALAELNRIQSPARKNGEPIRDLTEPLWASIDNDDSRDLDQVTAAEAMPGNTIRVGVSR
jgi:exoribonuclease R